MTLRFEPRHTTPRQRRQPPARTQPTATDLRSQDRSSSQNLLHHGDIVVPHDQSYETRRLPWRSDAVIVNYSRIEHRISCVGDFEPGKLLIIDTSLDPWSVDPRLYQALAHRPYWVLTHDAGSQHPRDIYFPQWLLIRGRQPGWWCATHPAPDTLSAGVSCLAARTWAVSCLNRFPRIHRYYVVRSILDRRWRSRALLSLGRIDWDPYNQHRKNTDYDDPRDRELAAWAMSVRLPLADHPEAPGPVPNDHTLGHPAFWDSYCNIITETCMQSPSFFTEKTSKPLAAGQLWCLVSGQDNARILSDLGFDVMAGIWQSHQYLQHRDWRQRIDAMLVQLDQVLENLPDVWQDTVAARQHNQAWLFGSDLGDRILQPLWDRDLLTRS